MPIFLQPQSQIRSNKVDKLTRETTVYVLGLQPRDKASMLAANSKDSLHEKMEFSSQRKAMIMFYDWEPTLQRICSVEQDSLRD